MNSFRRHNERGVLRPLLAVTLLVLILAGIDAFSGGAVRFLARSGGAIFGERVRNVSEAIFTAGMFATRTALREENAVLRKEVEELSALKTERVVLRAENEALGTLVDIASAYERGVTARIVSYAHASPYGTILLAAGAEDGVVVGDLVVVPGEVALGNIAEVSEHTSLMRVFFAPSGKFEVRIGEFVGMAEGRGSQSASVHIPRGVVIEDESPVYLAGTPFLLGFVGHIDADPADAAYTVYVGLPFNITSLLFVRIVRP